MDVIACFLSIAGALLAVAALYMIESANARRRAWFREEIHKARDRADFLRREGDDTGCALALRELETLMRASAAMGADVE